MTLFPAQLTKRQGVFVILPIGQFCTSFLAVWKQAPRVLLDKVQRLLPRREDRRIFPPRLKIHFATILPR